MTEHTPSPDRHDPSTIGFITSAVHTGNEPGAGAIRTPIVMANSYEVPDDPTTLDWSGIDEPLYTRNSGVNQLGLQRKLAALEGGEDAVVLASGVAALHAVFFGTLSRGDHAVVTDIGYVAVRRLLEELLPAKYGVEATFVDTSDLEAVRAAVRPNTRLIHTEVIANPTMRVAHVPGLAEIAHETGALLSVDSTFTPPPLFRPIEAGADLVVHSLTKYINGHGDAMGGAVIGRREAIRQLKLDAMVDVGGVISPFNAWLITRGAVTLPLRLRQHLANAQAAAEFLAGDPRVAYVAYPGLPDDPGHAFAAEQLTGGFGAMISFTVAGTKAEQTAFVRNLRVITSAVSLGHDESLIIQIGADDDPRAGGYPEAFREVGLLRFSVGIEDTADIVGDLAQALDATFGPLA